MPDPPTKRKPFNVLLSEEERDMLEWLAKETSLNKGQVVKQAIKSHYHMRVSARPTCATGQPCQCPQMHAGLQQALQQTETKPPGG